MVKTHSALSILGTNITTAYQAGAAIATGLAKAITLWGYAITGAASNSTSAEFKLQGSMDGVNGWVDLGILDLQVATPAIALSLTKNTGSSAYVPVAGSFAAGFPYVRVAAKFTGGAGKAGESLTATLQLTV